MVDSEDDLDTEGVQTPGLPPEEVVSLRSAPPARPVPPGSGVPAGALVLRRSAGPGAPAAASTADAALVEEFAQRAGIALAAATLYAQQVRTTAVLRSSLAQPPLPQVTGVTFGAAYRPSDEGLLIGGDVYDVLPRMGDATTFPLGDVCGKGVEAAVSTGQLRQSVARRRSGRHLHSVQSDAPHPEPPAGPSPGRPNRSREETP